MKTWAISVMIAIVLPVALWAEPTPTVLYLMTKKVSHFSFGLYQLRERIGDLLPHTNNVQYDWNANRILISALISNAFGERLTPNKENCEGLIRKVRDDAGVKSVLDAPEFFKYSTYASWFETIGYNELDTPMDLSSEIDRIIQVNVIITKVGGLPSIECEGPLVSRQVLFKVYDDVYNE